MHLTSFLPWQDEISTGLDSSTTYQIVRNLRDYAHLADATVFIALLQPAPEVFDLFDDVMLLSEGASHWLRVGLCECQRARACIHAGMLAECMCGQPCLSVTQ